MFQPTNRLQVHELECVRDDRVLFSGLEVSIESGEMLMLEGRNGSGKTSLLRILCGIRLPDAGYVSWCGRDIQRLGADYHESLSYVGHKDGIKQDLTPQENLRMSRALGTPHGGHTVDECLERFGLYGFEDVPTRTLSAGQQRRVALSRLLVTEAPLWILDEPFTSLDRHGIEVFESLMVDHLDLGGMIVLTTHHRVGVESNRIQRFNLSS
ncbi:MAG: cytochrome c biogenesis heme-transporting ATPase CcmA [Pseudomonadota bacterium]|nr:cytochrome c biogenesis heme-transporting ATPase CcmA [Pseudomonadota bacterium]